MIIDHAEANRAAVAKALSIATGPDGAQFGFILEPVIIPATQSPGWQVTFTMRDWPDWLFLTTGMAGVPIEPAYAKGLAEAAVTKLREMRAERHRNTVNGSGPAKS